MIIWQQRNPIGRKQKCPIALAFTAVFFILMPGKTVADTLTVAVASNFAETLEALAEDFQQKHPHELVLVRGSSGRHYAQIVNGAPFDLFFSADSERARRLIADGRIDEEQVWPYAIGRLALWAPEATSEAEIESWLQTGSFDHLSIANPRLAPYGAAATEVLDSLSISQSLEAGRIVTGENVAQAYQFVASGNADLGFVALSQLIGEPAHQYWVVPETLYQPITQELAVVRESEAGQVFLEYLAGEEAQNIIRQHGYLLP